MFSISTLLLLTVTHSSLIDVVCRFFYTVFTNGGGDVPIGAALLARLLLDLLLVDVCAAAAFLISSTDALCAQCGSDDDDWCEFEVANCVKEKWSETWQLVFFSLWPTKEEEINWFAGRKEKFLELENRSVIWFWML